MVEKKLQSESEVLTAFSDIISDHIAGDPQQANKKWTGLKPKDVQQRLLERQHDISYYLVRHLFEDNNLRRRSYLKQVSLGQHPQRDEQFNKIAELKHSFMDAGMPVLSIDTKNKELLGNFYRKGSYYANRHRLVNDHDFNSHADGILVPHGIYDVADNFGYLTLGTSKDTSAFVCDNIRYFWQQQLQWIYPTQEWLLLLCDGGGSNNARHYIVKQDLYQLAKDLQINIVVAHYPPYCSKWNPIEHRLFCHVHHAWDGAVFNDIQIVKELAEKTATKTGLGVKVRINEQQYQTGRKVSQKFRDNISDFVYFDEKIPQWNYQFHYQNRELIF